AIIALLSEPELWATGGLTSCGRRLLPAGCTFRHSSSDRGAARMLIRASDNLLGSKLSCRPGGRWRLKGGPGTFGLLLHRYRPAAGFSQEEFAERAGLSITTRPSGFRAGRNPYPERNRSGARNACDSCWQPPNCCEASSGGCWTGRPHYKDWWPASALRSRP